MNNAKQLEIMSCITFDGAKVYLRSAVTASIVNNDHFICHRAIFCLQQTQKDRDEDCTLTDGQ